MSALRATIAIVRRSVDRRFGARLAAAALAGAAIGVAGSPDVARAALVLALARGPATGFGRRPDLIGRVSLYAMPLYGRQLARALAIAPAIDALAIPSGVALGAYLRGRHVPRELAVAVGFATVAGTLVALSARLRTGPVVGLYALLAVVAEAGVLGPYALRVRQPGRLAFGLAAAIGFTALRGFGEALARYDPLPRPDPNARAG